MKKRMKSLVVGALVFGLINTINSQNVNIDMATETNLMSKDVSAKIDAQGSPYVNENFEPIKIKQFPQQIYTARYNAYNGEMEVKLNSVKVIALDNYADFEVIFTRDNDTYRTYSYTTKNGISKNGFLNVVGEGDNYALLKEQRVKYYEMVPAVSTYQQDKPAKFRMEDPNYYIKLKDGMKYIPTKSKDLLKAFPKQAKKIKTYMKNEKLNPKDEEELVKIVAYISTL